MIKFQQPLICNNLSLVVSTGGPNYSVSLDGRFVAYERRLPSSYKDIYLRDLLTGLITLVTTNALGTSDIGGNGNSYSPQISYDGRYVVFASQASNLVPKPAPVELLHSASDRSLVRLLTLS